MSTMFVNETKEVACALINACTSCVNGACTWFERVTKFSSCVDLTTAENLTRDGVVFVSRRLEDCLPVGTLEEIDNSKPTPSTPYARIEINDWLPLVWILSVIILVILLCCLAVGIFYCVYRTMRNNQRQGNAPPVGFSLLSSKDRSRVGGGEVEITTITTTTPPTNGTGEKGELESPPNGLSSVE